MTPLLKLTLFGAPTVMLNEAPLTGALTGKLLALFIYLAVTGSVHRREDLADLFWSELPPAQRRSNLRYLLADLRRLLGDYLLITPQTVSFNRQAPYWLDVEVVRTALGAEAPYATAAQIAAARALYQGEFLAGLRVRNAPAFMQWVATQRRELQALLAHAPQPAPDHPPKHNLPGQLTPFFGREAEIADILTHLTQDDYRLLTIIGEGGVGKTRLALAVAQTVVDGGWWIVDSTDQPPSTIHYPPTTNHQPPFPDGVWFVPLVELTATPDLIDQLAMAIAQALDLPLAGQGAPSLQVCHFLTHKALLLLLDNFEQLADQADFLLPLLQNCPGLRLLITSRRQLNVQAEYPWRLTGLPLPALSQATNLTPIELGSYAGVALFVERARRAFPPFQMTAANQAAVVAICHLLEGLPLGLELAAALCKEYSCTALLALLQADYRVLTATLPDLPARHRSIRGVLDHSWRLLDDETAAILATCTIFHDSFTAEAAAAVTSATAAHLHHLVDHALLRINHDELAGRRYELHELVRRYAKEQLAQAPARHRQALAHHAAYYLAQLQHAEPLLLQTATAQAAIRLDFANIMAAWRWSVAEQRLDLLAQGVEALARFCQVTGLLKEGAHLLQAALIVVRQQWAITPSYQPLLTTLLRNVGELYIYLSWLDEADALLQEALLLGEAHDNNEIRIWVYDKLARVAQRRNHPTVMRKLAEQAYVLADNGQDVALQASCSNTLAVATFLCGDVVGALHWYHQALDKLGQSPDTRLVARLHNNMGHAYRRLWDYEQANDHLAQALTLAQRINDHHTIAVNGAISGDLWLDVGAFDLAQRALSQAINFLQEVHDPYWAAGAHSALARLLFLRGDYSAAIQECERALVWSAGRIPYFEQRALTYYGDAHWMNGDVLTAEALYRRALSLQTAAELDHCLAEPAMRLAELHRQRNEHRLALRLLEKPLALIEQKGPAGSAEPFGLYYISYLVFKALHDPRADLMLEQADRLFQATLAKIADGPIRQSFLTTIAWRRDLWALVQAHGSRPQ